ELGIIRIDNPLGGAGASFPAAFVPFTTTGAIGSAQGNAPQPGGGTVATNDRRTLDAVLDDNLLFVTFTTGAGASNPYAPDDVGEATAVLVQVDVSDATPSNWTTTDVTFFGGERFGENTYTFFPSVAVSGSEALVGFSYAGANAFAGMAYAKVPVVSSAPPNPNVPSGIIPIAVQAKAGEGRYPWSPNRWGDYTGTVVDPVDGTYWVFNEFAKDVGTGAGLPSGQTVTWGTWVSQTSNANAPSPAPLPVELTAFDAVTDGRDVQLAWTTLTETDNAGFEIELRTGDADFETLDFVSGAGTTDEPQSYSYRVVDLEPGAHTFRLKQIDFDGVFDYSPEIEAFVGVPEGYRLTDAYPNPFNPQTRFELMIARDQDVRIEIVDLLGRVVRVLHNGQLTANQTHVFTLDAAGLPSGTYLYRAVGESFVSAPRSIMLIK
ncbi:MAG: T9SS type A sorting domain-containing protein, partial [Bacteroidota bacterium]